MLTKHHRYIKYEPLKAKLYQLHHNSVQYIFTSCFCVLFMDSERNTIFSIYSRADPMHFRTIDIEILKDNIQIKNGEFKVVEIQYKDRVFGIATKPFLFQQLREMLKSDMDSSISIDLSRQTQTTLHEVLYNVRPNHFVKSKVESQVHVSYESKLSVSNTLQLAIQKNGNKIELWMTKQNKLKLIHEFALQFSGQVSRMLSIPNTEYVCISFRQEPVLWFYNIDTGEVNQLNLTSEFRVEDGIVDFIFSKEMYKQEMMLITPRSIYALNLAKFFNGEKKLSEISIVKEPSQRFIFLHDHSLSAYAFVLQNIHQKKGYKLHLAKGFGTSNVFFTIPISKRIIDLDFSAKILVYCYDDGTAQLTTISSFDSEAKCKDPIKLRLNPEDIEKLQLKNQKFKKVKISYNRTFVAAAIKNLIVMWRMKEVLQGQDIYEISSFRKRVIHLQNWREDGEHFWVGLEDRNVILSLID